MWKELSVFSLQMLYDFKIVYKFLDLFLTKVSSNLIVYKCCLYSYTVYFRAQLFKTNDVVS